MNTGVTKSDRRAKLIELIKAKKADKEAARGPHQKRNDNHVHKREAPPEVKLSEEAFNSSEPNQSKYILPFYWVIHAVYNTSLLVLRKKARS